jgi:hypothetical protein
MRVNSQIQIVCVIKRTGAFRNMRINIRLHSIRSNQLCCLTINTYSRGQGAGVRDQERFGITTPHLIRQPAQQFCPPL